MIMCLTVWGLVLAWHGHALYCLGLACHDHVLIMAILPQNGHAYSAHNFLLIYRVAHAEFLANATEATIDIVGRHVAKFSGGFWV